MQNVVHLLEFKRHHAAKKFVQDMLIARVTGACATPATAESSSDPENPIAPCGDGYSEVGSSTGSGHALLQDAPVPHRA
jgi:hypothetical protein